MSQRLKRARARALSLAQNRRERRNLAQEVMRAVREQHGGDVAVWRECANIMCKRMTIELPGTERLVCGTCGGPLTSRRWRR